MIDTNQEILRPVIALIAWTLVMLAWLMATRLPAMKAAGVDLGKLIGGKGSDADGALPTSAQWTAHNHNHLLEQPTLSTDVAAALAMIGKGGGLKGHIACAEE